MRREHCYTHCPRDTAVSSFEGCAYQERLCVPSFRFAFITHDAQACWDSCQAKLLSVPLPSPAVTAGDLSLSRSSWLVAMDRIARDRLFSLDVKRGHGTKKKLLTLSFVQKLSRAISERQLVSTQSSVFRNNRRESERMGPCYRRTKKGNVSQCQQKVNIGQNTYCFKQTTAGGEGTVAVKHPDFRTGIGNMFVDKETILSRSHNIPSGSGKIGTRGKVGIIQAHLQQDGKISFSSSPQSVHPRQRTLNARLRETESVMMNECFTI